jgi:hypothetical protein
MVEPIQPWPWDYLREPWHEEKRYREASRHNSRPSPDCMERPYVKELIERIKREKPTATGRPRHDWFGSIEYAAMREYTCSICGIDIHAGDRYVRKYSGGRGPRACLSCALSLSKGGKSWKQSIPETRR